MAYATPERTHRVGDADGKVAVIAHLLVVPAPTRTVVVPTPMTVACFEVKSTVRR
jgi:hypothetical protein